MQQYSITGMSCAACSAKVEKAVSKVEGVDICNVNLLTNSMSVEGKVSEADIIKAVEAAGYGAKVKDKALSNSVDELKDEESPKILRRLIVSILFLLPLMYVSMGHMMWNWPVPEFLHSSLAAGLYEMILSAIVMIINRKFFINGFKGLIHKAPNMDTLIALGSMASFIYSVAVIGKDDLFFESAAMILVLITVGKYLEARSKGKTTDAIKGLMKLAPQTAILLIDGRDQEVSIEEIKVGDHFVVKAGENIPVDGKIVEGTCAVNEAALTGESIPVDKKVGDKVYAATLNQSGYIVCQADRVGEDTTLSKIIQMVSDAAAGKAPIAKLADKVSGIFVPSVMAISLVTLIVWLLAGKTFGYALTRAVAVLVISCPCALGLATPVAIMVGNGKAARNNIMFKTATALEETGKVDFVALDKTGTITMGMPKVTSIVSASGVDENELLRIAYSLESKSIHPLSQAIVDYSLAREIAALDVEEFKEIPGSGLLGKISGKLTLAGNYDFIKKSIDELKIESSESIDLLLKQADEKIEKGHTPIFFASEGRVLGLFTLADTIKEDSVEAIEALKDMGLTVVMLTGDNQRTAKAIGDSVGVDAVVANVKPDGKLSVVNALQKMGRVAMVGDGINDAPALTKADIGVAIGAGTDIAIDAADLVLMKSSLKDVAAAINISRYTMTNIRENLFWAFIFNIIGIPLAAGVWINITGWTLKPMFGAAAMSLSSFIVVTNALRINFFKAYKFKKSGPRKSAVSIDLLDDLKMEDKKMEITVNGMMCHHCEAHVKAALEKIDGVIEAVANHEANLVTIKTDKDVAEEAIKAAVVEAGYEYVGIK